MGDSLTPATSMSQASTSSAIDDATAEPPATTNRAPAEEPRRDQE
ncbi:hypothetical protein A2U01_0112164 [Trifolium medium]|uniref:Uncharacterized protein n=1 Tax=Trifolium medium TaxID=97028 RepID=A0A392VWP2_9FABA|nr:hypothetical protein [Trifolium medium]